MFKKQEIAKEILRKMRLVCPDMILAGGAPSDWYRGVEANDLDFYLTLPEGVYDSDVRIKQFCEDVITPILGIKLQNMSRSSEKPYASLKSLKQVYEGTYKGVSVQFMFLVSNHYSKTEDVINDFDASITKAFIGCWDTTILTSPELRSSLENKVIIIGNPDNRTEERSKKRLEKLIKKYDGYLIIQEGVVVHNGLEKK